MGKIELPLHAGIRRGAGAKPATAKLTIKVDKYFKDGDCIHTKCIIYVTNDHNATDKTATQAIAFKFGGINLF